MTEDEAREAIMETWNRLPVEKRVSEPEADAFATQMMTRFDFEAPGDRHQLIKGWLLNSFGMP